MRTVLTVMTVLLLFGSVLAQEHPTTAQMNAQKQQMLHEMQKQIDDLEKQIATAKANNEEPESINQMESQLATMKKMVGSIDNINLSGEPPRVNLAPVKKTLPIKYRSPIVPMPLRQPVVAPTEAQAKDKLLWYKGKKLNDSMLVTVQRTVVLYSKRRSMVIVHPDERRDSPYIQLVAGLSRTEQRKNQFVSTISGMKNSFLMYPEILKAYEEFDFIRIRLEGTASNTVDIPALPGHAGIKFRQNGYSPKTSPSVGFGMNLSAAPTDLELMYQQLKDLLEKEPAEPLDFPPPPKRPSDVCLCDEDIRKKYEQELSQWSEIFWGFEENLLQTAKKIHGYLAFNSNATVADMAALYEDVDRAIKVAFSRKDRKNGLLIHQYSADPLREETLVLAVLTVEREKQKMGVAVVNSSNIEVLRSILNSDHFQRFIEQRIVAKEYNQALDYSLYLSHEFHRQLLGSSVNVSNTGFFKWKSYLDAFNRFELTIDMDFEYHQKDEQDRPILKATGILKSQKVLVSLGRLGCKWQLFITDTNYENDDEDDFRIPVRVINGLKKIKVKEGWEEYPYVGPQDMLMVFPSVRISFCQTGPQDSALLDVLRYKGEIYNTPNFNPTAMDWETSGINNIDRAKLYTVDLLAFANKMLVSIDKTYADAAKVTALAVEMMNFRSNAHLGRPTGNSILDQLQIEYTGNLGQHEKQKKLTDLTKVDHTVVLFKATNGSPTLIKETVNTANLDVKIIDLVRGLLTLDVVHTPGQLNLPTQIPY